MIKPENIRVWLTLNKHEQEVLSKISKNFKLDKTADAIHKVILLYETMDMIEQLSKKWKKG